MVSDPKLLIKFPTRGRRDKFFKVLNQYIDKAKDLSKIAFLISMDEDDEEMNNPECIKLLEHLKKEIKLVYFFGNNKTKIQAINADLDKVSGWDIVLLASDDMIPVMAHYDHIIRKDMNDHFRDTDGMLWYSDGGQNNICTLSVLGKKYYDRFGYIYNPNYISLWCDNEQTEVGLKLKKVYKSDLVIIEHQHPVYQKTNYDTLYLKNESYYHVDKETYEKRKQKNFDLNDILLSILTPSVPERLHSHLIPLLDKIKKQIGNLQVEHLIFLDNRKRSIGFKRDSLVQIANGKYLAFVDDDDDISDDYVSSLYTAIKNNDVDVITFDQYCYVNNNPPSVINFSLENKTNQEYIPNAIIKRLPFHVCAWKTQIAQKHRFVDENYSEDWYWCKKLLEETKTEYHIPKRLHSYIYKDEITTTPHPNSLK
jgi:hypothetical protein